VLELGCGDGGNLIPLALTLPGAELVGIDLAAEPVARGTALAAELGAANVTLLQGDLAALPGDLGRFDYVIAHGVYSWVPPAARDGLMAACGTLLNEHGVAYVSYNAYPGSYLRDAARDMLRFHVAGVTDPARRMEQADALMRLIVRAGRTSPHARALAEHLHTLLSRPRWVLFHDELADVNTPVYFHEFVAHAARHGLQFLAESNLADSQLVGLPEDVAAELARLPDDAVVREQYIDFVGNRLFRQTLLCRAEAPVRRALRAADLRGLWVAADVRTGADPAAPGTARFDLPAAPGVETDDPQLKAALARLGAAWPRCVRFDDLAGDAPQRLGEALLGAHAERIVDFHVEPPPAAPAGERPVASVLARHQVAAGAELVTNLRHTPVHLPDAPSRELLAQLDGSRDRAALDGAALATLERLSLLTA
jgi:methyltransferase-like protein/SAM-dependent methyltransferase